MSQVAIRERIRLDDRGTRLYDAKCLSCGLSLCSVSDRHLNQEGAVKCASAHTCEQSSRRIVSLIDTEPGQ